MSIDFNELKAMNRKKVLERCAKDKELFYAIFYIHRNYFTEDDLLNLLHIEDIKNFLLIQYLADDYFDLMRILQAIKLKKELEKELSKNKLKKKKPKT